MGKKCKISGTAENDPYQQGFTNEEDMGEVAFQALNYALKKMAEEIAQDPEVEKNSASATIDGLKKTYARR